MGRSNIFVHEHNQSCEQVNLKILFTNWDFELFSIFDASHLMQWQSANFQTNQLTVFKQLQCLCFPVIDSFRPRLARRRSNESLMFFFECKIFDFLSISDWKIARVWVAAQSKCPTICIAVYSYKSTDHFPVLSFIMLLLVHEMPILWRSIFFRNCTKQQFHCWVFAYTEHRYVKLQCSYKLIEFGLPAQDAQCSWCNYSPFSQWTMNLYTSTTTPHNGWCVLHSAHRLQGRASLHF